jgi:uncharacterized protein (TIGR01244 family)
MTKINLYACATIAVATLVSAAAVSAADGSQRHAGPVSADNIHRLEAWGTPGPIVAADGLYFAGQPDADGFVQAAAAGVTKVINIRHADEVNWDIAAAVENAGMAYYNVPLVLSSQGIDAASAARISELVQALAGEQVLVHCASGNRVAVWWALHLAAEHGMGADDVVRLAELAGMKPALAPLVESHLRAQ